MHLVVHKFHFIEVVVREHNKNEVDNMKLYTVFAKIGAILFMYALLAALALVLVVQFDTVKNPFGDRCNTSINQNIDEIFYVEEVKDFSYHLTCNTLYLNATLDENASDGQVRALLIKYALLKEQNQIPYSVEVLVKAKETYFSRLLNEGAVTLVG